MKVMVIPLDQIYFGLYSKNIYMNKYKGILDPSIVVWDPVEQARIACNGTKSIIPYIQNHSNIYGFNCEL